MTAPTLAKAIDRPTHPRSQQTSVAMDWRERLYGLALRYSYLGIEADLAALSLADSWGLYRTLSQLYEE